MRASCGCLIDGDIVMHGHDGPCAYQQQEDQQRDQQREDQEEAQRLDMALDAAIQAYLGLPAGYLVDDALSAIVTAVAAISPGAVRAGLVQSVIDGTWPVDPDGPRDAVAAHREATQAADVDEVTS